MGYKGIGAVLIIAGCGGFGFSAALRHRREEKLLRQLIRALEHMACELQYHRPPLPELCYQAAQISEGRIRDFFSALFEALEGVSWSDVHSCVSALMPDYQDLPTKTRENLLLLGKSMGRFDLEGQTEGLSAVREICQSHLKELSKDREARLRGYQTLGLCTGAALAVLLV